MHGMFFFSHIDKVSSFYSIIIVLSLVGINVRICEKYNFNQQVTRFSRSEPPSQQECTSHYDSFIWLSLAGEIGMRINDFGFVYVTN